MVVIKSEPLVIHAPVEVVWDVLVSLDSYGDWNPFTYRVESSLVVGEPVVLFVKLGQYKRRQVEYVKLVESPTKLGWGMTMLHPALLKAYRIQCLEPINKNSCRYFTNDTLEGLLTPLVVKLFGRSMEDGFNEMSVALKEYAENLWGRKG